MGYHVQLQIPKPRETSTLRLGDSDFKTLMKRKKKDDRFIRARCIKISTYLFILYALSFPFLTVSCTDNMRIKYTGFECITGRTTKIVSLYEAKPIVYIQIPYLIVLLATFVTIASRLRFWKMTMVLDFSVVFIFLTITCYVTIKKIKTLLIPKNGGAIFGVRDKIECDLNYGFWVVFVSIVVLALYDISGVTPKRNPVSSNSRKRRTLRTVRRQLFRKGNRRKTKS